jgi:hypothetical protein
VRYAYRYDADCAGLEAGVGITGFPVQPNKAIVGANAFAHESGIHQDGVLKHRETYEIMRAEDVGWSTNKLVLGKHSGRNAFRSRLQELGVVVESEEQLNNAFARFKALADKKHEIFDEDLQALMSDDSSEPQEHFRAGIVDLSFRNGRDTLCVGNAVGGWGRAESGILWFGSGRCSLQGDRDQGRQRYSAAAVLGQCDYHRYRRAG